jgi:type I restriction enzyme M protein
MNPGDLIEAVILLPENLFYNTTAPGIIMVLNKSKAHPGEVLLINASKLFFKGRPKNHLTQEHIEKVAEIYHAWLEEKGVGVNP